MKGGDNKCKIRGVRVERFLSEWKVYHKSSTHGQNMHEEEILQINERWVERAILEEIATFRGG